MSYNCKHNFIQITPAGDGIQEGGCQYKCSLCGSIMAIGPGRIVPAEDLFRERVVAAVIADLKSNGPIRHAMLGIFPDA